MPPHYCGLIDGHGGLPVFLAERSRRWLFLSIFLFLLVFARTAATALCFAALGVPLQAVALFSPSRTVTPTPTAAAAVGTQSAFVNTAAAAVLVVSF